VEKVVIDLYEYKLLKEGSLANFGASLKYTLQAMFGYFRAPNLTIRGTSGDINKFVLALAGEKKHMESYLKHGLEDPRTLRDKYKLKNAVSAFERETGIKWPFK
jgi:hypothetical protein